MSISKTQFGNYFRWYLVVSSEPRKTVSSTVSWIENEDNRIAGAEEVRMAILVYWKHANYAGDMSQGCPYAFNSKQRRLHTVTEIGEDVFVVSGVRRESGLEIYLVAHLVIIGKACNSETNKYGRYRIVADQAKSKYFSLEGEALTPRLAQLTSIKHFGDHIDRYAQSFQTLRKLNCHDVDILTRFANSLSLLKQHQVI